MCWGPWAGPCLQGSSERWTHLGPWVLGKEMTQATFHSLNRESTVRDQTFLPCPLPRRG